MAKMIEGVTENILKCAQEEFLANGYENASLRNIAEKAGTTKSSLLYRYSDKEALFEALVSNAADGLLNQFKAAQDAHYELIPDDKASESRKLSTEYLYYFINYIYDKFDAFKLVICCSEGTKYETYIHDLVELEVEKTEQYYEELRRIGKLEGQVSHNLHHMLTSAYFTAVFETVAHDMTREEAVSYIKELAAFFNCGWDGILRLK